MKTKFFEISPVLPSQDIDRDVDWYERKVGFKLLHKDSMYAVLRRENLCIHLQWHADTEDDPLLGGSVIKIFLKNLMPIFEELVERGTAKRDKLRLKTAWKTNEFGVHDLNNNSIFFVEDL
ncbi:glyoxalase/bleomycin resistance/extradiol dioxygenase family protein [Galbibacter sp. EGI 63066]|uniref:glyoxalase/bleomycin resistance/extradiol dioxygenase family protein n=1 Tax=Galbibacter sp. EGI 63066 TaxID=2993559 RepID=UPI00224967C0|nr:glyoxalase/bleomycin resistance/extradiol dioxygenase family protein [Galbibacter sp. EGI 63066]MCX2679794.1 glyoxalase/bleomycin resistance/extradiol dioxygenase family protein [Galbibacter sp. EGI 63066]